MDKKLRWYETEPVIIFLTIILTLPTLVILTIGHFLLIFYIPIEKRLYKKSDYYLTYFDAYKPLVTHRYDFKIRNELAKMKTDVISSTSDNKYKLIKGNSYIVSEKMYEVKFKDNEFYVRYNFISNFIKLSDYYEEIKKICKMESKFECYIVLSVRVINKEYLNTNSNNVYFTNEEDKIRTIKTILDKVKED